ncbi:MAG: carboxypeptidase regulatory-like domain-containing protein [Planctomycetes bacterium]|nr:carboxypeptidase regulatory-like domain-containing protein [Planctomycetota bacterium]
MHVDADAQGVSVIELDRGGSIHGVVRDQWGDPIVGAVVVGARGAPAATGVTATEDGWSAYRRSVVTTERGEFRLTGLAPGNHLVCAEHVGFVAAIRGPANSTLRYQPVDVAGDLGPVDVVMERLYVGVIHLQTSVPVQVVGVQIAVSLSRRKLCGCYSIPRSRREPGAVDCGRVASRSRWPGGCLCCSRHLGTPRTGIAAGSAIVSELGSAPTSLEVRFVPAAEWRAADACTRAVRVAPTVAAQVSAPLPVGLLHRRWNRPGDRLRTSRCDVDEQGRQCFRVVAGK